MSFRQKCRPCLLLLSRTRIHGDGNVSRTLPVVCIYIMGMAAAPESSAATPAIVAKAAENVGPTRLELEAEGVDRSISGSAEGAIVGDAVGVIVTSC